MKLARLYNPEYVDEVSEYQKWRLAFEGGRGFINAYLEKFDAKEDEEDFKRRKKLSHCPSHAKQAVNEIINNVYQRMTEVSRQGGSKSYQDAIAGKDGGVDLMGSTMNSFLGQTVLPEMLNMRKVGVYVDMPNFDPVSTLAQFQKAPRPYLYRYTVEDIVNWNYVCYDNELYFTRLLLRERRPVMDEFTQMPTGEEDIYRFFKLTSEGVEVGVYRPCQDDKKDDELIESYLIQINRIPFVLFDIGVSLMKDIADFQVGLLNLSSSDLNYALKSNFPFYTEPYDPKAVDLYRKTGPINVTTTSTVSGEIVSTEKQNDGPDSQEIEVGATRGRRFPKDAQPPAFIHPSPEPLRASMEKQMEMKADIRALLNLAMANVNPSRASAESKVADQSGMESGLTGIGMELQGGEQEIAKIWELYLGNKTDAATITYPTIYKLKSDDQRLKECKDLKELKNATASRTFQREMSKTIANRMFEGKVDHGLLLTMHSEIDKANYVSSDPEEIKIDMELGLVTAETASNARGYDGEKEVPEAKKEHVERLKAIAVAQAPGGGAARGVPTDPTDSSAKDEKTISQGPDANPVGQSGGRN